MGVYTAHNAAGENLMAKIAEKMGLPPGVITTWEATSDGSGVVQVTAEAFMTMPLEEFNAMVEEARTDD